MRVFNLVGERHMSDSLSQAVSSLLVVKFYQFESLLLVLTSQFDSIVLVLLNPSVHELYVLSSRSYSIPVKTVSMKRWNLFW